MRKPQSRQPRSPRTWDPIEIPGFVREGVRSGLSPHQLWASHERRRVVWLAALIEEARQHSELAAFEPTPANVELLRDKHGHRWERIAVRVFGDPRGTRKRWISTTRRKAGQELPKSRTAAVAGASQECKRDEPDGDWSAGGHANRIAGPIRFSLRPRTCHGDRSLPQLGKLPLPRESCTAPETGAHEMKKRLTHRWRPSRTRAGGVLVSGSARGE
jgi:hypothetical protein